MENQRTLLYLSLAMLLFLLWSSWQNDYGPQPVATTGETATQTASSDSSAITTDVPGAVKPAANDMPIADVKGMPSMSAIVEKAGRQIIRVSTDKLNVEIDTRGGDFKVVKLLMLQYKSVSLE